MTVNIEQQILSKLTKIERDIVEIREHMLDANTILTEEEKELVCKSINHEKKGELISLKELENVRNKTR